MYDSFDDDISVIIGMLFLAAMVFAFGEFVIPWVGSGILLVIGGVIAAIYETKTNPEFRITIGGLLGVIAIILLPIINTMAVCFFAIILFKEYFAPAISKFMQIELFSNKSNKQ